MNDEQIATALIGEEAEKFLESDLGRTLIGMAKQDLEKAAFEFKDVDLKDDVKLRDIQNRIWRATQFESWLAELITMGREALEAAKAERNND